MPNSNMFTMGHISVTLIVPRKLIKQTAYLIQTVGSILMGVDKVMTTSIWLKYLSKCLRKGALFIQFFFNENFPRCIDYKLQAKYQGPVVQSIVSLTGSLRGQLVKCFTTL